MEDFDRLMMCTAFKRPGTFRLITHLMTLPQNIGKLKEKDTPE
jgi:hypothetical protein